MRPRSPRLSSTATGRAWVDQFDASDRETAASLLDSMLLLNTEQVSDAIRIQLRELGRARRVKKRRLALYAERKLDKAFFAEKLTPDREGRARLRAHGRNFKPIEPIRGGTRVGSEGFLANVISQVVQGMEGGRMFVNHPGPDRIRGKSSPVQTIVIVTDLIGSGKRIQTWLDALWKIKSLRSWVSLKLVDIAVVAAVSTTAGETAVRRHRLRPAVYSMFSAPVLSGKSKDLGDLARREILERYGPAAGRGASRSGFGDEPCLVAFSYRIPNNTPAAIHQSDTSTPWRALYEGGIPDDLSRTFGERDEQEVLDLAAEAVGVDLAPDLTLEQQRTVLVLSLISGRLRPGQVESIAQQTQLPVPVVEYVIASATALGTIDRAGRLTESGQAFVLAGRIGDPHRPVVSTNPEPYYPKTLRIPRAPV